MPIGHSLAKLVLLRAGTFLLDSLPLAAVAYSLHQISKLPLSSSINASPTDFSPNHFSFSHLVSLYLHLETVFFVYFHFQMKRLQAPVPPPAISELERGKTFFRILDHSDGNFREYFAGWFYWADSKHQVLPEEFHLIRKDNFRDWFSWMLYGAKSYDDLLLDPKKRCFADELNSFVQDFEISKKIILQPGRNTNIEPVILNYNRVDAYPKPLLFYGIIGALESIAFIFIYWMGFRRCSMLKQQGGIAEGVTGIQYWVLHRNPEGKTPNDSSLPIVFFHGIGCGLFPYAQFIKELVYHASSSPIFLVELPFVAMRLVDHVPSMEQTIFEVETMLDIHGFSKAMVAGHSLGSAVAAWMIKHSKYVAASVLLDPIVFLTFHPSLAFNFVHRLPGRNTIGQKANEVMMHWLCSREIHISYTISRHFIWHQAMIWAEHLPKTHHVVLSRQDLLLDAENVEKYLIANNVTHTALDIDHGEFLFQPDIQTEVVKIVAAVAKEYFEGRK
ncbi:hypothetical protein BDR26DRAFT_1006292 [Obelidium mucronatum]|nr:hypothetical protein BDR26DRAFT_1006292 [Obelidium mucronatum]